MILITPRRLKRIWMTIMMMRMMMMRATMVKQIVRTARAKVRVRAILRALNRNIKSKRQKENLPNPQL